jgi:hypothetical protein
MDSRKPPLFAIPPGVPTSKCRGCQATIYWVKTLNGKRMPVNADGTSHFSNCPKANEFRKSNSAASGQ